MAEVVKPGVLETPKKQRTFRWFDLVIFVILALVITALVVTIAGKLSLKREVSSARAISDQLVGDIAKQDAKAARSLGDGKFQVKNSEAQLKTLFASAQNVAKGTPTVTRQIVSNTEEADTVYVIYKYTGNKQPYYIRVKAVKANGTDAWKLAGISGNNTESSLIVK